MERKKLTITIQQGENVSAVLTLPPDKKKHYRAGVIVAHGAGNDMEHEMLVDFSDGLARAGYPSLRFNFPYKEKGLKAPDGQKNWKRPGARYFCISRPICLFRSIMSLRPENRWAEEWPLKWPQKNNCRPTGLFFWDILCILPAT